MGKNKSVVCQKCYRVMRGDVLKRHMKIHEKQPTKNNIFNELLLEENNACNN